MVSNCLEIIYSIVYVEKPVKIVSFQDCTSNSTRFVIPVSYCLLYIELNSFKRLKKLLTEYNKVVFCKILKLKIKIYLYFLKAINSLASTKVGEQKLAYFFNNSKKVQQK